MALEHEIALLGQRMGVADLGLSPEGLLVLDVQNMGRIHFERGEDELLVYLSRPAPAHDRDLPRRILELAHFKNANFPPLSGGLYNDTAVLLVRLPLREAVAATLESVAAWLAGRMDEVLKP